ncbi:symmetrical bis(5'-nucleosyl)-tetraphosphatase [Vibrio sp. SS-MA-C1-2]|uniref:symmetrical bis(5'-nucleosyl)-tetraphosphatase n=1 Tax=Vibrio sp. SS-MA-C1-2 TaxID=2908646 RepID=UPI001F1F2CA7|nr:symmetrical bis(5'-nucleosyl)-tetraphosphatase [Vibrio sp. SS-MA-C1-2]UJF19572.1 symmetrical bis(5'-nucleosyl)-tetraphosphatase [Vibrio sp. SS-MA-C1-2]
MATYLVGDIQGCLDELQQLLSLVEFSPETDTLWLAGDLVARGPHSLETLRFIKSLGKSAITVLGNHDLHLLATAAGFMRVNPKDKTQPIFDADDCDELLTWLRHQPLIAQHPEFVVSHAGIHPHWSIEQAIDAAREVETILKSDDYLWLIKNMYSNEPKLWSDNLEGIERYRFTINSLTRMRYCYLDGRLDMACKLPPSELDDHRFIESEKLVPWFELPLASSSENKRLIFGHWAALMGYQDKQVIGLDTGCVWGNAMTLLRWEDKKQFVTQCPIYA